MDHFGIGTAMYALARTLFRTAKGSGRSTSLIESLKDGDRVVFHSPAEAERVKRLCRDRRIVVDCITISPKDPSRLFGTGTSIGRTLFDHSWVEQYYLHAIENAECEIDRFQTHASGPGSVDSANAFSMEKNR